MKTYPIIPETKELGIEGSFNMFGLGNEKRDLVLLVRGDVKVRRVVCVTFFGCIHCGYMSTGTAGFMKVNGRTYCEQCEAVDTVYYFDGVWKGSLAEVEIGVNDDCVTVSKM